MNKLTIKTSLQKAWTFLPEICITIIVLLIFINSLSVLFSQESSSMSYYIIGVEFILLVSCIGQFFWKNIVISIIHSMLFGWSSIYMMLAVFSEYSEFPMGDPEGIRLLVVGLLLFGILAIIAFVMPVKYLNGKFKKTIAFL